MTNKNEYLQVVIPGEIPSYRPPRVKDLLAQLDSESGNIEEAAAAIDHAVSRLLAASVQVLAGVGDSVPSTREVARDVVTAWLRGVHSR